MTAAAFLPAAPWVLSQRGKQVGEWGGSRERKEPAGHLQSTVGTWGTRGCFLSTQPTPLPEERHQPGQTGQLGRGCGAFWTSNHPPWLSTHHSPEQLWEKQNQTMDHSPAAPGGLSKTPRSACPVPHWLAFLLSCVTRYLSLFPSWMAPSESSSFPLPVFA